jgi:hypothetical protein
VLLVELTFANARRVSEWLVIRPNFHNAAFGQ